MRSSKLILGTARTRYALSRSQDQSSSCNLAHKIHVYSSSNYRCPLRRIYRNASSLSNEPMYTKTSKTCSRFFEVVRNKNTLVTHRDSILKRRTVLTFSSSDFGSFSSGSESSSESVSNYGSSLFSRVNVRDPYRRLGVGQDATFDEIKEARNYLMEVRISITSKAITLHCERNLEKRN